jgi:hypothetical protein
MKKDNTSNDINFNSKIQCNNDLFYDSSQKYIQKKKLQKNNFFSVNGTLNFQKREKNIFNNKNLSSIKTYIYIKDFIKVNKIQFEIVKIKQKFINLMQQ